MMLNINYIQYKPIKRVVICITMILSNYVYVYTTLLNTIYLLTTPVAVSLNYLSLLLWSITSAWFLLPILTVVCIYYARACAQKNLHVVQLVIYNIISFLTCV
jgi:hypothetical protein